MIKSLSVVKHKLSALNKLAKLQHKVAAIAEDPRRNFAIAYWYDRYLHTEPCVSHAFRDLCKPGDVVFDVGANCGDLSLLASRLVGPKGTVCSFEASRRIVDKCQFNLMVNGCSNTTVYHKAVYTESNQVLKVYAGSHLNDTVMEQIAKDQDFSNDAYCNVSTVSLDDFAAHFDLAPAMIKMDIEGAEYCALLGSKKIIEKYKPILILEQNCQDDRCILMLLDMGYVAIDLSNYAIIKSKADFPAGIAIANVLFIHQDKIAETPYKLPITKTLLHTLTKSDFKTEGNRVALAQPITLDQGRYYIALDVKTTNPMAEIMTGVETKGIQLFRYHSSCQFILDHYNEWIIDAPTQLPIEIYFRFMSNPANNGLDIQNIKIYKTSLESQTKNNFGLCTPQSSTW